MKVLVTGGAGFIGSHVAEYFAQKGDDVIVFDNLKRKELLCKSTGDPYHNVEYLKQFPQVNLVMGDIRKFGDLKGASKGIDIIVHTAGQVAVTSSVNDPRSDFEINALGTLNVLEIARLYNASVLYCSTNKVYGNNVNTIPVREEMSRYSFNDERYSKGIPEEFPVDLCGHSPYGCSKLSGDFYCQDYAETYGLRTGVFRMSCVYGERQFGVEDQGWISWFTIAALKDQPITIYGDGKQVRDVLHVSDLVCGFDAFIKSNVKHGVFNFGGGPNYTLSLLELLELLTNLLGKRPQISFAGWRASDQKVYISRITKANKLLKWAPQMRQEEGVSKMVKWLQTHFLEDIPK